MKILFVQYWYDYYGGIETVNDSLASQFSNDGYDVTILCLWKMGKNEFIKIQNYKKIYIDVEHKRPSYKKLIKNLFHLRINEIIKATKGIISSKIITMKDYSNFTKEIKKINPDHIIVGNYPLIKFIPKEFLNRCFLHMHSGFKYYLNNKKEKNFLLRYKNKIDKYIWLSPNFMDLAIKEGFTNSTYMFNPVRIYQSKNNSLKKKNIGFIGRLSPEKGLNRLVDIFKSRDPKYKDWNLLIYGSGDSENLDLDENIKLMGPTDNVKEALQNISIFALTSFREGFPMVILEAYECGIPVIAYDFEVSSSEIIKNGVTGYIIEQDNKDEYLKKLEYLLSNEDERKKMGENAKKFVNQFHKEKVVKRWYSLFKGEL